MKTVTIGEFMKFNPCWGYERICEFAGDKTAWNALEVIDAEGLSDSNKLWAVLREEFIDASVLHEFACRCAVRALGRVEEPDIRSITAVDEKRKWVQGETSNEALDAARAAAWQALWDVEANAVCSDGALSARGAARSAIWAAARNATWAARTAAAVCVIWPSLWPDERSAQVEMLRSMLVVNDWRC